MEQTRDRRQHIQSYVVTAEQMRQIEARVFASGMPVAALMEKVGGLIAQRIRTLFPLNQFCRVGVLAGPGHNGGDALVVARELHFRGYQVQVFHPFNTTKQLTTDHAQYAKGLGIHFLSSGLELANCQLLIDGFFGFGLERSLTGAISDTIDQINRAGIPVVSIDLPSGLHTDTGAVLGTAIRASHTLCLGLWKLGLLQDQALDYVGQAELIDFDLPLADVLTVLGQEPAIQRLTKSTAIAGLPLPRPPATHKYQQGHCLLVGGSQRYAGSIILAGLAARATGIGMLSIAVPESLKSLLVAQLPEALIVGCPETANGAIAQLPDSINLSSYNATACGPGLTTDIAQVVQQVLASDCPLILDADGLNILAQLGTVPTLQQRQAATILTPHPGEFKRLFPEQASEINQRAIAVREAAQQTGAFVLLKGARVAIANPQGQVWINPDSTPALARGGSGDVLTGLMGGLLAQAGLREIAIAEAIKTAVWWHAQAGIRAAAQNTELGVDALTLTQFLIPTLQSWQQV
jgi:ADP-dependent NAD(P)H-hydrate dehydratase / NAD(P)H-hydrate epimerase